MAVVAALMALRPEMAGREKWLWAAILFTFALIEIRAINRDRDESEARQEKFIKEQRQHFNEIGEGITGVVQQSDTQFKATVRQQSQEFSQTMSKAQENLNHMTGGDSYPIVMVLPVPLKGTPNRLRLLLTVIGRNPLFDINVQLKNLPLPHTLNATEFVTTGGDTPIFSSASLSPHRVMLLSTVEPSVGGQSDYLLITVARNGTFMEKLHVRSIGDTSKTEKNGITLPWEQSWEITKQLPSTRQKPITSRSWTKTSAFEGSITQP
jgi:hypothetical protein